MSIFKDTFTKPVRDQLKVRGNAFLKRTSNDIIYINGRAAWARMVSGVDVGGDSKLAKENILQGGLLQNDGKSLRQGVGNNFTSNAYSNTTNNTNNFYGLRPMPGITSIDVQSKSAYGSVRVATVTFNCWDIRQLEILELLYMRPGFTVLLEWGWLPYLNNNGDIETNTQFYDIFKSKISPKTNKPISLHERLIEVYNKSKENDANYEGILGYVKNYSWSQRPDGGYDCTTEIISTGEVLESLKVNYSVNYIAPSALKDGLIYTEKNNSGNKYIDIPKYGDSISKFYQDNILAGVAAESIFAAYTKKDQLEDKVNFYQGYSFPISDTNGNITGVKNHEVNLFLFKVNTNTPDDQVSQLEINQIQPDFQVYMDLDSFTKILSKHVVPADPDNDDPLIPITTKSREYPSGVSSDLYCLYHPLQISMDPRVCLIKNDLFKRAISVTPIYNPPSTVWEIDNLPANQQGFALLLKSYIKIFLNSLISLSGDNSRIVYIKTSLEELKQRAANNYGITDVKIIGRFLANAWEEYKYKNVDIQISNLAGSIVVTSINYRDNISNNTNDTSYASETEFINKVTQKSLIDVIKSYLGLLESTKESNIILALGEDYNRIYSPDAYVALTAKDSIIAIIDDRKENIVRKDIDFKGIEFLDNLSKNFRESINGKSLGNIGNIYVNLLNVIHLATDGNLEANDVKEKQEINLYDFIKKLMGQVQSSIGNLNNFEIHADPIDGIGRIIDINYVDEIKASEAYSNAFTFISQPDNLGIPTFNGLVNNVRSYKINSKIFKEQSSIVAISAQNGGGVMGLDNETLVGFQRGLTNRLVPNMKPSSAPRYVKSKEAQFLGILNQSLSFIATFLKDIKWIEDNVLWFDKTPEYDIENSEKYKNALRDMIKAYIAFSKNDSSFKSIIPTTVSLELDGIGGIIIGHMFRLPDEVLPIGYKGDPINNNRIGRKLGYIVTRLGHKIADSDWVTNIEAQTIILEDPEDRQSVDFTKILEEAVVSGNELSINLETGEIASTPPASPQIAQSNSPEQDFWTLVAICAREAGPTDAQGQADVAQSIYNRLGSKAYSADSITKLILYRGQYEPTWRFPRGAERGEGNPNSSWYKITSASTAATATGLPGDLIFQVAKNIQRTDLQRQAAEFVQGRTDFLGSNQPASVMTKNGTKKQRTSRSNQFGFSFNYNKNVTYAVPNFINKISVVYK